MHENPGQEDEEEAMLRDLKEREERLVCRFGMLILGTCHKLVKGFSWLSGSFH